MEKKKIIGYRCKVDYEYQFTKGKIYKLRPGKNLWSYGAFIDDRGEPNGWSIYNDEHFEPVYDEDVKTVKDIINSIYGLVLNKNISTNINPELTQYLNSINNKMENKKIYYLKQEVKLNQEIDFNGLKITVTQDLINNNPNLFHVEEEKEEEKYDTVLCINDYIGFKKGNTYKSIINITTELYNNHFVKIDGIKYYKSLDGFIYKYYINIDSKGSYIYYDTFGNECNRSNVIQIELASTKEEYNKQQEIIKNFTAFMKLKECGKIYKTTYRPNHDTKFMLSSSKSNLAYTDINVVLDLFSPATEDEYDLQEELQELLDEAQKRYPVGTKLSKDCTVTLHPDKKTYLVYPNRSVDVHIGNGKYFKVNGGKIWITVYKEPVKDLEYYEDKYYRGFYSIMKKAHPNLYYQLMLQTIADDLNGDWTIDWNDGNNGKYYIMFHKNIEIAWNYNTMQSNVYFKTKALAQKAIDILGEDKLKIIFNVK